MQFSRFMVISWNEVDGLFVDHFETLAEAEKFAKDVASEGFTAQVTEQRAMYEAEPEKPETPESNGIIVGVDCPATLGKRWAA